jgi:hypothetical protein
MWIVRQKCFSYRQKCFSYRLICFNTAKNVSFKHQKKPLKSPTVKACSVFHSPYKIVFKIFKNDEKPPPLIFLWVTRC